MNAETDETRVECSKESFAIHLQTSSIPRDATGGQLFHSPLPRAQPPLTRGLG